MTNLNINTISSGFVAALFGATGPILIIIDGAATGDLTYIQTISWIFAVYFFGGLFGILMALKYRQPIAGAFSIAGAVLVVHSLSYFSINEAVGAYLIACVLIIILGFTGLVDKIMRLIPVPIVMGMIVGILIHFAVNMIAAVQISPLIAGAAIVAYLISTRFLKRLPPVLLALITVFAIVYFTKGFQFQEIEEVFVLPEIMLPNFSLDAIISISIPLALIIICTENAQATGVLKAEGYKPPTRDFSIYGSMIGGVAAFFGAHAINVAGPMTAICASKETGAKQGRYVAAVVTGILFICLGIFASFIVPFILAMPAVMITVIAGLAMINVLLTSLQRAFSAQQFQLGAFFAFIIGMSGINFFGISAPLWAIIGSLIVSFLVEKEDFKQLSDH